MSVITRFWAKVDKTEACWNWTAALNADGYGHLRIGARPVGAHRVAYELFVGPIPVGLELDHVCRNRACVNPAHLEPVTHAENTRRSAPAQKTHCKNGHPYDAENTYLRPGHGGGQRDCRTCIRQRVAKYRQQKEAA